MPKRLPSESPEPPSKRHRPNFVPHIKRLSDELFLRIASFLQISDLTSCQRVSKRFSRIATDGQVWKALFYRRFVRPRASRIPGASRAPPSSLHYSSRNSRWLEDEGLARTSATNWKQLYKLRHNWNRGICSVSEIDITPNEPLPPPVPPLLVRLHEGMVFTVDPTRGLRAWKLRRDPGESLVASADLYQGSLDLCSYGAPTSMAVDEDSDATKAVNIVVGFENGGFGVYQLDIARSSSIFMLRYIHTRNSSSPGSSHGPMITSMAYCTPYLLTMAASQLFTVYRFERSADIDIGESKDSAEDCERMMHAPKILTSLRSHTVWPPLSLSLRRSAQNSVIACIVYAFPLYISGWSVGIQELRFSDDTNGTYDSRIATAVPSGFNPFSTTIPSLSPVQSGAGSGSQSQATDTPLAQPTCLSYTHPYLLASHADNTLTLYLVKSTATSVSMDSGQRLWGHTSGVSTAQVSSRGKAVSISTRGSELRVWELEGGVSEKRRLNASVRVEPSAIYKSNDVGEEWRGDSVGWLGGFDEEKVVVLREKDEGRQALVVYDFTR